MCAGGKLVTERLSGGSSPCAGTPDILFGDGYNVNCGLHAEEASVLCRALGCGQALQASKSLLSPKVVTCQGTESSIFNCRFNFNLWAHCMLETDSQVVCSGRGAEPQGL